MKHAAKTPGDIDFRIGTQPEEDSQRNPDQGRDQEGRHPKTQRGADPLPNNGAHRATVERRAAKIALHHIADPGGIANRQRIVEPELLAVRGDRLRRRLLTAGFQCQQRGVALGSQAEQERNQG